MLCYCAIDEAVGIRTLDYTLPNTLYLRRALVAQKEWRNYMDDSAEKLNNSSLPKQRFEPQGVCCQVPLVMYCIGVWFVVYAPMFTTVHGDVMLL